jgi:hypothetical protein
VDLASKQCGPLAHAEDSQPIWLQGAAGGQARAVVRHGNVRIASTRRHRKTDPDLPGAAMTNGVFDGFRDDAVQLHSSSSRDSLRPCRRHEQLEFDRRPDSYARANPAFDELDQVPFTVTTSTLLAQEIAKLRKRFAGRPFEAIDAREPHTQSLLFHPKFVQLQQHRR